ncbi:hypothetical protein [Cetobacterium somerae]|uniref:hypothetical protein n=1 Tax=Cetobacterium somerae TaxID=188913 RepID=UPI003892B78F
MNIGVLEIALKKFVEENTRDLLFLTQNKKDSKRPVKVFSGFIPPNTAEDEIPAIAIRFNKGDDASETRYLYFDLYFAIFNKETEGYKELTNLIERVINRISEEKYIGDYFVFEDIAEYEIEDEQPYPFWIGNARIKFSAPKPSYVGHREGGYFG